MLQWDHRKRLSADELIDRLETLMTTFVSSIAGEFAFFVSEGDMIGIDDP